MENQKPGTGKTILVIDDDESVLSFLSYSLKTEGFDVMQTRQAEGAFKLFETKVPDLILLDVMLPKMDGFTFCKELRKNIAYQKLPVILITAYGERGNIEKAIQSGAQGLMEKPLMFDELLLQVMEALNGRFSLPSRYKFAGNE